MGELQTACPLLVVLRASQTANLKIAGACFQGFGSGEAERKGRTMVLMQLREMPPRAAPQAEGHTSEVPLALAVTFAHEDARFRATVLFRHAKPAGKERAILA